MTLACLIPLMLCFIAAAITLGTDAKTLDGIPGPLAAITGIFCLIWFVIVSPWLVKLGLVILVLVATKFYLGDSWKVG